MRNSLVMPLSCVHPNDWPQSIARGHRIAPDKNSTVTVSRREFWPLPFPQDKRLQNSGHESDTSGVVETCD